MSSKRPTIILNPLAIMHIENNDIVTILMLQPATEVDNS